MIMNDFKRKQMEHLAIHRNNLRIRPHLNWLFFELTNRCNLQCKHCGSKCSEKGEMLTVQDVCNSLNCLQGQKPMICLTGGEPLMHPDFFKIADLVNRMGFLWGMTTNATLIKQEQAKMIRKTGMSTVSVSLDGLEETHDRLRGSKGAWKRAVEGIKHLQDEGYNPQVTTVFHAGNINELDAIYDFLCELGIISWRPINVEPIGRACESSEMLLSAKDFQRLISYIRNKRFDPSCKMEVTFGCSHFLGFENERMVRDNYFLCGSGILTASIRSNGDICGCLDIENRPELVQGNIRRDDFLDVWQNRFSQFRVDRTEKSEMCSNCTERFICAGDSMHTWDFDRNKPLLCGRDIMESV